MRTQTYSSQLNKKYDLGTKPFAKGGEGAIYDVIGNTNLVAKIYNDPKKITNELKKKLERMATIKSNCQTRSVFENYAWPEDVLYKNKKFVGYVMPRIKNTIKLKEFYPYSDKINNKYLDNIDWKNRLEIAINLCVAVHNIHHLNQVIGDLNPDNVLVQKNGNKINVILVDTDSYHITVNDTSKDYFRCGVAKPLFVAPELQGKDLRNIPINQSFTEYTDRFSLAVLIFLTLMNGVHPFSCSGNGVSSSQITPADFIKKGITPFFPESNKLNLSIKIYALELSSVFPETTKELFKKAFIQGIQNPQDRPSARQWYEELLNLSNSLCKCSKKTNHHYYYKLSKCPWCKIENKVNGITEIDEDEIKNEILNVISQRFSNRNITEDTTFYIDLDINDKDINNIILQVENKYNISFDNGIKKKIKSINGIKELINFTVLNIKQNSQPSFKTKTAKIPNSNINNTPNVSSVGSGIDNNIFNIIKNYVSTNSLVNNNIKRKTNFYIDLQLSDKDIDFIIEDIETTYDIFFSDDDKNLIKRNMTVSSLIDTTNDLIANSNNSTQSISLNPLSNSNSKVSNSNSISQQKVTVSTSVSTPTSKPANSDNSGCIIILVIFGILFLLSILGL